MRTRVFGCPATECILVVSKLSPSERGGRMEGRRLAIIDLPLPGAPTIIKLCPPAAATSSALFTFSCPFNVCKIQVTVRLLLIEFFPCINNSRL